MKSKIRIAYVLKSADVETLFSSRYSENSSHAHTRRHPHTFTHTCAHQCTLVHTYAHPPTLRTPAHTHTHSCIPAHTHSSSRTHSSSSRWVWTDQSYVIRPNTKKADRKKERRKRKEQESAESISGLKNSLFSKITSSRWHPEENNRALFSVTGIDDQDHKVKCIQIAE